jgi:hypothetical protein
VAYITIASVGKCRFLMRQRRLKQTDRHFGYLRDRLPKRLIERHRWRQPTTVSGRLRLAHPWPLEIHQLCEARWASEKLAERLGAQALPPDPVSASAGMPGAG